MSRTYRVLFFFIALVSMVALAVASASMAADHAGRAVALYMVAVVWIAAGFVLRRRLRKDRQMHRSASR